MSVVEPGAPGLAARDEVVAEGMRLVPWHLDVEIAPGLTTRDFADAPYDEQAFGKVRLIDSGPRIERTLDDLFPRGLEGRTAEGDPVAQLEDARRAGATHLAIPAVAAEWFEGQPELRRHVRSAYPVVADQPGEFALHLLVARRAAST